MMLQPLPLRLQGREKGICQTVNLENSGQLLDGCGKRRRLWSCSWNSASRRLSASRPKSTICLRAWIRPTHCFPRHSTSACEIHLHSHNSQEQEHATEVAITQADQTLLMSKINELTVYHKSNATLCVESEAKGEGIA